MITVVYCTRQKNPSHKEHLIKLDNIDENTERGSGGFGSTGVK